MKSLLNLSLALILQFISSGGFAQWNSSPAVNHPVCVAVNYQDDPRIASDGNGGAFIAWTDMRILGDEDIYAQHVDSSGMDLWATDGIIISGAVDDQLEPVIVPDGSNGAIIAWVDRRTFYMDVYAQRVNASGIVQWAANGVPVCTAINAQAELAIVSDGMGGAIIAWEDVRNGPGHEIFAQRIDSNGVVQWTTDGQAICTAANVQEFPAIVSDGSGGAIITWGDYRSGSSGNPDIYAQRINSIGLVQWPADGLAICNLASGQIDPDLISDNYGGAIIAWEDSRNGFFDIYSQRVNSAGTLLWTINGVAVATGAGAQNSPVIAPDGNDGAIISFHDTRNDSYGDLYAQRINANGVPQWIPNGVVVSDAVRTQGNQTIVADGLGGAIITWQDHRTLPRNDIYAQRIDSAGSIQWANNGLVICNAFSYQEFPFLVSDESGGAIITWEDSRNSPSGDIYATRVFAAGTICTGPVPYPALGPDTIQCGGGTVLLDAGNPGATYLWSNAATTQTITVPGTGTFSVSVTDAAGCTASDTIFVGIYSNPSVVYTEMVSSVCSADSLVTLSPGTPSGGVYSGTAVTGNTFNPASSGAGTFIIQYSFTNVFGCTNSDTSLLTVHLSPTVVYNESQSAVCAGDLPFTLTAGSPIGGSYSGTAVVGNIFDPASAGAGSFPVIYSFTSLNGCPGSDTSLLTVNPLPIVVYNESQTVVCSDWAPITLDPGAPSGGTYSGTAVAGNMFDPGAAGIGSFNIIYTYMDVNGCTGSDSSLVGVIVCTGIQSGSRDQATIISPNPGNGLFTIASIENESEIDVVNEWGNFVYRQSIQSGKTEMDLTGLPDGIYFYKVISNANFISAGKIIIAR